MLQVADLCGGEVQPWAGAPVGEQFELYGECKSLDVLVPPIDLAFSQWMECWSGGGCKKRCDGQVNVINDHPCSCDPDNPECKPTTRLGVILTAIQGIGIWRLETHGWNAAAELNGAIEVLRVVQNRGAMIPARLMLEQRQSKKDGKTHNFAVPVLDLNLSVAALTGGSVGLPVAQLPPGVVTPISEPELPGDSVRAQVAVVAEPTPRAPRANAAPAIPATGIAPRPAAQATEPPKPQQQPQQQPTRSTGATLSEAQGRNIARLFSKAQITDRQERLDYINEVTGGSYTSSKDVTKADASKLITELMIITGEVDESGAKKSSTPRQESAPLVSEPPADYGDYSDQPF